MAQLLFANNATTTLAGAITSTSLSLAVSAGSGVEFPSPVSGTSYFCGTLVDAATGLLNEIVWVTSRSGDTMTVTRAREGTTALNWNAGDLFSNLLTAGSLGQFLQIGVDPPDNFAVASGTNIYAITWNLAQTTYAQGNPQGLVYFTNANTSATCSLNDGSGAKTLLRADGLMPGIGDVSGYCFVFFDGSAWRFFNLLTFSDIPQVLNGRPPSGATFNTAGTTTWTCPAGVTLVRFELWGAGGAGGAGNQSNYGWGGAGGGYARGYAVVVPGTVYNITIGAGGVCPNVGSSGSSGGSSSFASFATANGGGGGPGNQSNVNGTAVALGGTASTGSGVSNPYTQTGGNGGAPLGPWTAAFTPGGGGAAYGGSGGIPAAAQLGQMGAGPGAGGAGGSSTNNPTGQLGGAGTVGTLLLSWQS